MVVILGWVNWVIRSRGSNELSRIYERRHNVAESNFFAWTLNVGKQSACSWYRVTVPFMHLRDMGYVQVYEDNQEGDPAQSQLALMHSDIGHYYALTGEDVLHRLRALKRIKPGRRA